MCAAARDAGPPNRTRRFACTCIVIALSWVLGPAAGAATPPSALEPSSANAGGIEPRFEVAPAPDWVVDVAVPESAGVGAEALHDGVADLLTDTQVRIGDQPEHAFNRYVSEVVEPTGVSSVGRIQIDFAATYQTLELHWIRLVRDGVVQERLDPGKVRILQQEEDIDLHMYHQTATALVLLDDVRVGDRVDYAFSLVGANPIFEGRYQDWLYLEWWYPFGRIHNRIVAPEDRALFFERHNTDELPERRAIEGRDGLVEWVWQGDAVGAALSEDSMPSDLDPLAAHQVSEFETWGEVASWASSVFEVGDPDADNGVRKLAEEIRAAHATDEERIIAALRFVQDDVRYLGLEIGVNAFRPHAPALTLERRFGDCKDKSSLLVALLTELGVEAHVALVNTELAGAVEALHPTASAFDHAIVRVTYDGRSWWLDPTLTYERGPLADEEWFEYGHALVVDVSSEALDVVEPHESRVLPARIEHAYTSESYTAPTQLEVRSTYRGDRADSFRAWAASMANDSIERQYQNYYARDMPDIELAQPLQIEDDEVTNTIVVTERYRVPDLWWRRDVDGPWRANFVARELRDELSTPDTVQRTHPLAVAHPVRTEVTIRVDAAEPIKVRTVDDRIEGPAFALDYAVRADGDDAVIDYVYVSTADRVAPGEVGSHLDAVDEAWNTTEYRIGTSRLDAVTDRATRIDRALRNGAVAAVVLTGLVFIAWPTLLLRRGVGGVLRGDLARATTRLRMASRMAPARSGLARRSELALSLALGTWGRRDEALGLAARMARLDANPLRARLVRAAAWAWRAELARDVDAETALAHADRGVDLARELTGADGWAVRACTLSTRAGLRARGGDLEAAARDLDEARSHRSEEGDRARGWLPLLRLIANTDRAAVQVAAARGDLEVALRASERYLADAKQRWPAAHPALIDAMCLHAECLMAAGDAPAAVRAIAGVESALGPHVDAESPLRTRAAELRAQLAASG